MAIIKLAAPLAGIRGTIAGITYSANASSLYAKAWARSSNPRSALQMAERSNLAQMPDLWRALSDAERADWRTFASDPAQELTNSLGEDYFASGFNWFSKCNIRLLRVGRSTITAIPTQARPAAPTISNFYISPAGTDTNLATGGTPSASTEEPANPASNAFDGSSGTRWQTLTPNPTGWLKYVLTSTAVIRRFAVHPGGSASPQLPKDFTFERWNGATWDVLKTVTNYTWTLSAFNDFWVDNDTTATDYRIDVTLNHGSGTHVAINEVEMYSGELDGSVIVYPEGEFEASTDYDLVLKISQGQTTARFVQYPGFKEILAVQGPGSTFEEFQSELGDRFGIVQQERSWFARLYRQTQEGLRSAASTDKAVTL